MSILGIPKLAGSRILLAQAPEATPCERLVEGAVQISRTDYCADRFGIIYDESGEKVHNGKVLRRLHRSRRFAEAQEAAEALYRQLEAEQRLKAEQPKESGSAPLEPAIEAAPLEEGVQESVAPAAPLAEEPAPSRRGPPPPYLRLPVGEGEARGSPPPHRQPSGRSSPDNFPGGSYSSEKKEGNKSNDVFGYILTIGGAGLLGTKLALDFATDPCPEGVQVGGFVKECHRHLEAEDYVLYTLFGAALVAGIYLLVD